MSVGVHNCGRPVKVICFRWAVGFPLCLVLCFCTLHMWTAPQMLPILATYVLALYAIWHGTCSRSSTTCGHNRSKSQKSKLSARACWCLHKIHSNAQMQKVSTDSADVCTKHVLLIRFQSGHCPRLYISPGHLAQPQISYNGIFQKKNVEKKDNNKLYSKGHVKPISTCILQTLSTWPISGCAMWIQKIFLVELFLGVYYPIFAHGSSRFRVCGGRISGNKSCVRGAMIHWQSLASRFQLSELWDTCSTRVFLSMTKQVTSPQTKITRTISKVGAHRITCIYNPKP